MEKELKTKDKLNETDINTILLNLIRRRRFNYTMKDIATYIFKCLCLRKVNKYRHSVHPEFKQ